MADGAPSVVTRIDAVTVRGRAMTAERGRAIAAAVAPALAARFGATGARIDRLTLRLPASAVAPDGAVDPAMLRAALNGQGGDRG